MKEEIREKIKKFCNAFGLGTVTEEICSVSGGLLHTMYRVETTTGVYALKMLNPEVMQRPEALQNMVDSETIAHVLETIVPLVAAKEIGGKHVVQYGDTWFMVFDWLEGNSVFAPDITAKHCAKIGELLGKIHGANVKVDSVKPGTDVRVRYAWEKLCDEWKEADKERETVSTELVVLAEFLPELLALDAEVVRALKKMSSHQVISHRDLDPKNVMWQENKPYIIDWEAAGYVNPYQELAEVLNYWITDAEGNYNFEKFEALMEKYTEHVNAGNVNWDMVLFCSFDGMFGWLEYNVKRAAGLLGNKEEDRMEGKKQVIGTISEIKRQKMQMVQLKYWLQGWKGTCFKNEE